MQIKLTSVFVDDQDKALKFYTEVLGFVKKMEFRQGITNGSQWSRLKNQKACNWFWSPTTTRPRRRFNRRSFGREYPPLISSSRTSKRSTQG